MVLINKIRAGAAYSKQASDHCVHIRKVTFVPSKPQGMRKSKQSSRIKYEYYSQALGQSPVFHKRESVLPELMMAWLRDAHPYKGELSDLKCIPSIETVKDRAISNLEMAVV